MTGQRMTKVGGWYNIDVLPILGILIFYWSHQKERNIAFTTGFKNLLLLSL
jgi:hypothetical protein